MKSSLVFNSTTASVQKAPLQVTAECVSFKHFKHRNKKHVFVVVVFLIQGQQSTHVCIEVSLKSTHSFLIPSPLWLSVHSVVKPQHHLSLRGARGEMPMFS